MLATDPRALTTYVLESEEELDDGASLFFLKPLTHLQSRRILLFDGWAESDRVKETLRVGLAGWRRVDQQPDVMQPNAEQLDTFCGCLALEERIEIAQAVTVTAHITASELRQLFAATRQAFDDDVGVRCPLCRMGPPEVVKSTRAAWGCDAPSPNSQLWHSTCPYCRGTDHECVECSGGGTVYYDRCPASFMEDDGRAMFSAYNAYRSGFLPAPGALYDQAATFVASLAEIDNERAVIDEYHAARKKRR